MLPNDRHGAHTHFLYAFTDAELRRKGRMTTAQRRKRHRLESRFGPPHPRAIEHNMAALLDLVAPEGSQIEIHSDEHPAYPRAWRRAPGVEVRHAVTPSKQARTSRNPLFPVNRADLWLRHSGANHKRETIAFSKRRASVVERCAILSVYLNYQKSFSEKKQDATPAQRLGIMRTKLHTRGGLGQTAVPVPDPASDTLAALLPPRCRDPGAEPRSRASALNVRAIQDR